MATADQILELRRLINQMEDAEPWTDAALAARIDAFDSEDMRQLAAYIWREKAASYASLVDVQEGNSKRTMSQLYKQALEMASAYSTEVSDDEAVLRRGARTRKIERQ